MSPTTAAACRASHEHLESLTPEEKQLVAPLLARVEDWKGHCLCSFGVPVLYGRFMISRNGGGDMPMATDSHHDTTARQYQVFLFSNILLCCRKRNDPNKYGKDWALKGRVFLRNVYDVQRIGASKLMVNYHGDEGSDAFIIDIPKERTMVRMHRALLHYTRRAAVSLDHISTQEHYEPPPPVYYSPLPEYSLPSPSLSAPLMERHSPLNTPLNTPPLYSPLTELTSPFDFSAALLDVASNSDAACRPSLVSTVSTSTIHPDCAIESSDERDQTVERDARTPTQLDFPHHQSQETFPFDEVEPSEKQMPVSSGFTSFPSSLANQLSFHTATDAYRLMIIASILVVFAYAGMAYTSAGFVALEKVSN